jgi:hypothetical protein
MPGLYYLTPTSGVVDTAGPLLVGITATGCNPIPIVVDVVEAKQVDTLNQLSAVPYDVWNTSTSGSFSSTSMAKQIELARKVLTNKTVDSGTSITLYDDDGVSVLGTFTWNDVTGVKGKLS